MNPLIIFGIGLSCGAIISGTIVYFFSKKKNKKEIDDIYAETSKELTEMKHELDEFHRIFVTSQSPEIAGERESLWKQVAADVKKGRKKIAEEKSENPVSGKELLDKDEGITTRRDDKDRTDYHAIGTPKDYLAEEDEESADGNRNVIRSEAANGIIEIDDYEARTNNYGYKQEDLYFYENSSDLYTDDETLIDIADVPLYVGYTSEELAIRFLHYDEPQFIHILNPEYERIYTIYVAQGRGPDDH
jgi:uncharacterized membrane-anchored protein YhcB (DUF1043 family)